MANNHFRTLTDISNALACGEISSEALTREILARIQETSNRYRAFETVFTDAAIVQAKECDQERIAGKLRGPLHGVPIALKDLIAVHGAPSLAGSPALKGWNGGSAGEPEATVAIKLRSAGAVLLGKLKTTEGAHATHHPEVSPPLNPWNQDLWSGVSSSGSGVATAAGLCFASLGTDTGGSIRFPSFVNGAIGLKPTWGRVSRAHIFPLAASMDHIGPITRSVEDAALMLQVIAGPDELDPTAVDLPVPDYVAALKHGVAGLKIGIDVAYCEHSGSKTTAVIQQALKIWRKEGATIVPISMPDQTGVAAHWNTLCVPETAIAHEGYYPERADQYGPVFQSVLAAGHAISGIDYARAHQFRLIYAAQLSRIFGSVDLIVSPTYVGLPPLAENADALAAQDLETALGYTVPTNLSGSPTLSLRAGCILENEPLGFQLIGRHFTEDVLLRAGYCYQERAGWKEEHPS